jgi:nuclear transport factor 2 (NTF2) superfamily protein
MKNPLLPITEAEEVIDQRRLARETQRPENRTHLALEVIADEMTRMRAELAVLRAAVLELRGGVGKSD